MGKVIAEFFGAQFELTLTEKSDSYYIGVLKLDEGNKERFYKVQEDNEEEDDSWYLDNKGYRLADTELFAKSPWSIIEDGIVKKVVRRFQDGETGEIQFAMQPWFRIGDEYNNTDYK